MNIIRIAQVDPMKLSPSSTGDNITADYAVSYIEPVLRRLSDSINKGDITFKHQLDKESTSTWIKRCLDVVQEAQKIPPLPSSTESSVEPQ